MRKRICFVLIITLPFFYGTKQRKVERYMEERVEVVINHLEPSKIKGEPSNLILEEEFTIDTESDELAEKGLADIKVFDVDTEGNIWISNSTHSGDCIFRFDRDGKFITSFAKFGQESGELRYPSSLGVNNKNQVLALSQAASKLAIYSKEGKIIKEIRQKKGISLIWEIAPI